MLSVLKSTFVSFYNDLFKLVLLSTAWFILTVLMLLTALFALSSGAYLMILIPLLFLGPIFLSSLYGAAEILEKGKLSFKAVFRYFKANFWRAFFVFLISTVLYLIFLVDLRFFLLKGQENVYLLALAFLFAYLLLYFTIYQLYLWGLLIVQPEKKLKEVFKNALVLSLDNIVFSLLWFLSVLILTLILIVIGIGVPAGFIGIIGLLIILGTKEILAKY